MVAGFRFLHAQFRIFLNASSPRDEDGHLLTLGELPPVAGKARVHTSITLPPAADNVHRVCAALGPGARQLTAQRRALEVAHASPSFYTGRPMFDTVEVTKVRTETRVDATGFVYFCFSPQR